MSTMLKLGHHDDGGLFLRFLTRMSNFVAWSCSLLAFVALAAGQDTTAVPSAQSQSQRVIQATPLTQERLSELREKADAGDASAQVNLGKAYHEGNGVPHDAALALKWFRKAADQGDATAENELGVMYRMGDGVEADKVEAVRWYHKAAKQGNANAMFNLGASYYNGDGVDVSDFTSYVWFFLSREAGDAEAEDALRRSESERGVRRGDVFEAIGKMYEAGEELQKDSAQALQWFRRAADLGLETASVRVASVLLMSGRPLTQEESTEVRRRCESVANRYGPAAYCMAAIYRRGLGVTKDPVQSGKWLSRSADMGFSRAVLELGEAYWKGDGVKQNLEKAYMLIWIAYNAVVPGADQDEQKLREEMSAKQVKKAQEKAQEWSVRHHFLRLRQRATSSTPHP